MSEFVRVLIAVSEKAANIARIIRSEKELFQLLVEEKGAGDKNERFVQDFKTLADVLIQECLRHDISTLFPTMSSNIFGEECNTFTNALGESITVSVQETVQGTADLLGTVLNGNLQAAKILAEEVHKEISMDENTTSHLSNDFISSYSDVGVWIDPIDGTNEYIRGSPEEETWDTNPDEEKIWSSGLHCVTVLIGAFNLKSGQPIVGVINQPFWKFDSASKKWQGRKFWGVSISNQLVSSLTRYPLSRDPQSKKLIILSPSEDPSIKEKLKEDFDFVSSSGAGYKLLCVALGLADIYILSKPTTHFWDTCGPHAILKSLGGGIISYGNIATEVESEQHGDVRRNGAKTDCQEGNPSPAGNSVNNNSRKISSFRQVTYNIHDSCKDTHFANLGGILAYRENQTANAAIQGLV